jgi:hypothetical protein
MGPRAGRDTVVKRKFSRPCRDSNPRLSSPQPRAIPLRYPSSFDTLQTDCLTELQFYLLFFMGVVTHTEFCVRLGKTASLEPH